MNEVKEKYENIVINLKNGKGKYLIFGLMMVLVVVIGWNIFLQTKSNKLIVEAKSSIEKIVENSELRTVSYTYNAVAKKCKDECTDDGKNDIYFISYQGKVTAGLDFEKVIFEVDKSKKKLLVSIPEATITTYNVEVGKNKYIFLDKKYDNGQELNSAQQICLEDLKNRVEKDNLILDTAKNNAKQIIRQFYEPLIKSSYKGYTLEVR